MSNVFQFGRRLYDIDIEDVAESMAQNPVQPSTQSVGSNTQAMEAVELPQANPALIPPSTFQPVQPSTVSVGSFTTALEAVEGFRPMATQIALGTVAGGAGMLLGHLTSRIADKLLFDKSSTILPKSEPQDVIINVNQRQYQRQNTFARKKMKK